MDNESGEQTMAADAKMQGEELRMFSIPQYTARMALRQAESALDEINAQLRNAERDRDSLARKMGAQQDMIDRLRAEANRRTNHMRALSPLGEIDRQQA